MMECSEAYEMAALLNVLGRSTGLLMVVEAVLLLGLGIYLLRRWWPLLNIDLPWSFAPRPVAEQVADPDASTRPQTLARYLVHPVALVTRRFLLAWACWIVFYVLAAIHELSGWDATFWRNLFQNGTTYFLLLLYVELTSPRRRNNADREYKRVLQVGWLFIFLACTVFEYLLVYRGHVAVYDVGSRNRTFQMIYGMGQAVTLFLVIGRLENVFVADHIRTNWARESGYYRAWITLGYGYAALQPLYTLFEERNSPGVLLLVFIGLLLKGVLAHLMDLLLQPDRAAMRLSPMEHHLYEVERFTTEDQSSFERNFLRLHLGQWYRRKHRARNIGYLGVEYTYLNDYKREHLQLSEKGRGGIWVTHVHMGSDAATAGIRVGDYITHVDRVPLGRNNRLSIMLDGMQAGKVVELRYIRLQTPQERVMTASSYEAFDVKVKLAELEELLGDMDANPSRAGLGCQFLYNSPDQGVVCVWNEDFDLDKECVRAGREQALFTITAIRRVDPEPWFNTPVLHWFETPDVHMLRIVLNQCLPGDQVELHGSGLYARKPEARDGGVHVRIDHILIARGPE